MGHKLLQSMIFFLVLGVGLGSAAGLAASRGTPLMEAAFNGNLSKVQELLVSGARIDERDRERSTPLMVAASQGHLAITRELLAKGADINAQNRYGWTPLMLAAASKRTEVVKLLLAKGADQTIRKNDGDTALTIAKGVGLAGLFTPAHDAAGAKPAEHKKKPERLAQKDRPPAKQETLAQKKTSRRADTGSQRRTDERRRQVQELVALADRQMKALRLTLPVGDNAHETYRQLLQLDPGNSEATAGLSKIAERYHRLARQQMRKGLLQKSLTYIERGLKIQSENTALLALRDDIQAQQAAARHAAEVLARAQQKTESDKAAELAEAAQTKQREIDRLLAEAGRQLKAGRLTRPQEDNAYATYRRVLQLDPDNTQAEAGLTRIATQYERLAQGRRGAGALQESLVRIDQGLEIRPRHAGLLALRQEVQIELAAQEEHDTKRREIARLLAEAERHLKAARYTQPEDGNAHASFRQVLALDPDNAEAQAGIQQIASEYAKLARKHHGEGALRESLADIERGIQVLPTHPELLALRKEVQAELTAQENRQRAMASLLAEAKRHLKAARLTQPDGRNAHASFRQVLALDPDNAEAQAGLEQIAARYAELARKHREKGALRESLADIELGIQVLPTYPQLLALRKEVQADLTAQEDRQREIVTLLAEAKRHLKAARYTQPEDGNAHASYRQILALDPDNAEAQAGIQQIATRYAKLAHKHRGEGALRESLANIQKGLQVLPTHLGLLALRQEVQAELTIQENRQREIARLLAEAKRHVEAARFTQPEDGNAYASLRQVLALDPNNAEAQAGIQQIATRYAKLARQHRGEGALRESLANIQKGLQVLPTHLGLLALRKEVRTELTALENRQREIARLLAEARRHVEAARFTEPEDGNAYTSYHQVLKLDPDNPQARAGLIQIATQYEKLARQHRSDGALQQSLSKINQGLHVTPEHPGLLTLRKEVQAELTAKEKRQREIETLLAQAERDRRASRFIEPADDNAYARYRQVLALDPDNTQAQTGLEQITTHFETLAHQHRGKGDLLQALSNIELGLQITPKHAWLLSLRKEVQAELTAQQNKQREIETLLAEAKRHIEAARFTQPEDDNAHASYRQVLALDPTNAVAQEGLAQIANRYSELARKHKIDGALSKALSRVEQGLQVLPAHTELLALAKQLRAELAAQEKRQREITRLLTQAKRQFQAARYTRPKEDNANASYREVLTLDPNNAEAQAGLEQIATQYEKLAREQRVGGALQKALSHIEQGLQALPGHPGLVALAKEVHSDLEREMKQRKIARLLTQAERQLKATHWTQPAGDNAHASYREILTLDPSNAQAQAGLARIATQFEELARKHRGEGAFQQSLAYIEQGLKVLPRHPKLLAFRQDVRDQLAKVRREEAERERQERERARKMAEAQEVLREKLRAFYHIEKQLDAEERTMRLSIQELLEREWMLTHTSGDTN